MTPKFYGKRNSEIPFGIQFERGEIYQAYLKQFREGTRLEITVKKYVPKRSNRAAEKIVAAIAKGQISHITINY